MSIKNRYTPGDLYEVIDQFGSSKGHCIFMEIIEPGTLTLEQVVRPMHWHVKVLHNGKIELYDTSLYSLIDIL
ncbi:hypothetical protein EBZ80_16845 [bacterium]|nr:hypothetical protein [bacterium]